jgi:predicted dehydrogenase
MKENLPSKPTLNRRDFLRGATGATLAAAVFPNIIAGSARGADGGVSPSNRVVLGVIGCGPQGIGDMNNFLRCNGCQVVAVCDVKSEQTEAARKVVNEHYGNQDCRTYSDFRELVARKDIDACLIATPDHWHVLTALAAVNSGKDVYVEKPLGLTVAEDRVLRAAVHRKKRVFQFGTQQRSGRWFHLACELARNSAIGKLQHINAWAPGGAPGGSREVVPVPEGWDYQMWLGPAAYRPLTENLCSADGAKKTWWFVSDFAVGFIAGWGIHPLDIAAWGAGDLMNGPFTVEGRGNYRAAEGICDTATICEVDYRFASGLTMKYVGVPNGGNEGKPTGEPFLHGEEWGKRYRRITSHGTAFEGSAGWAHVDREGINLQPENLIERNPDDFKVQLIRSSDHAANFIDCVKSRAETVCPIDAAVKSDILCHTGDIAMRLGRRLTFDFGREQFVHDAEANRRLEPRSMRAPWGF